MTSQNAEQVHEFRSKAGRDLNSQQGRILSLAKENTKLKKELWHLKKVKGQKMALKSLVTVLINLEVHFYTRETVK